MFKKIDSDETTRSKSRPSSSKIGLLLGMILLLFIGSTIIMHQVTTAKNQTPPVVNRASGSAQVQGISTQWVMDEVKDKTAGIGKDIARAGGEVGGAVLGETVRFFQKTATQSAQNIASSAANVVIQSTVPGIAEQINKLPEGQKSELKKLICQ